VRGYLANQSGTGTKTDTPLRETPQSITVVTADRVTDQGALTVQESLRYVPGVFADAYGLIRAATIRAFAARIRTSISTAPAW
jgi:iron complex outermembrane receptor protein